MERQYRELELLNLKNTDCSKLHALLEVIMPLIHGFKVKKFKSLKNNDENRPITYNLSIDLDEDGRPFVAKEKLT